MTWIKFLYEPSKAVLNSVLLFAYLGCSQTPRFEIGAQVSGIRESLLGEYPVGAGGRVTIHAFPFVGAEAEVNRFPSAGTVALFPATQLLFAARVGRRFGQIGVLAKLRPGVTLFDTNAHVRNLGAPPALDFGGIIECYSRRHLAARFDFGDTAGRYSHTFVPPISAQGSGVLLGTRNQLQRSFGVSAWL